MTRALERHANIEKSLAKRGAHPPLRDVRPPNSTARTSETTEGNLETSVVQAHNPIGTTEDRLCSFQKGHPGVTYADVKYTATVYTPDFQKWRKGQLKADSKMSQRIEDVLSGKTPIKKKTSKPRLN